MHIISLEGWLEMSRETGLQSNRRKKKPVNLYHFNEFIPGSS